MQNDNISKSGIDNTIYILYTQSTLNLIKNQ